MFQLETMDNWLKTRPAPGTSGDGLFRFADELCMFDNVPESITRFFDFKAFARELFMSDYDMGDGGHVFRTC